MVLETLDYTGLGGKPLVNIRTFFGWILDKS